MSTTRKHAQACSHMANQESLITRANAERRRRKEVASRVAAAREMHDEMASRAADLKSYVVVTKVSSSMTKEEIIATILGRA